MGIDHSKYKTGKPASHFLQSAGFQFPGNFYFSLRLHKPINTANRNLIPRLSKSPHYIYTLLLIPMACLLRYTSRKNIYIIEFLESCYTQQKENP